MAGGHEAGPIRYLSGADVAGLAVPPGAIADAIEDALVAAAAGAARNFPKTTLAVPDGRLWQATLAGGTARPAPPFTAVKVLGLSPDNAARGLPHMGGLIVLLAEETGLPVAVMDAQWITDYRTAALTLVAARRLARPQSRRIGFVACGAQAVSHLTTFASAYPIREVTAYSRRRSTAEIFAAGAADRGLSCRVADRAEDAVRDQDIVVTSVPAAAGFAPMLKADWLAPGTFAGLVDLGRSWHEAGFEAITHRVTDDRAQSEGKAATRKLTPAGPYTADLAELVTGKAAGRGSPDDRAVFVFQGLALADLAAAALVHARAAAAGVGLMLPR